MNEAETKKKNSTLNFTVPARLISFSPLARYFFTLFAIPSFTFRFTFDALRDSLHPCSFLRRLKHENFFALLSLFLTIRMGETSQRDFVEFNSRDWGQERKRWKQGRKKIPQSLHLSGELREHIFFAKSDGIFCINNDRTEWVKDFHRFFYRVNVVSGIWRVCSPIENLRVSQIPFCKKHKYESYHRPITSSFSLPTLSSPLRYANKPMRTMTELKWMDDN